MDGMHGSTSRQSDRQVNRQTNWQIDIYVDRPTEIRGIHERTRLLR